jgi:succinate dehydrogenase/fumarate reductase-like Fe-S protein
MQYTLNVRAFFFNAKTDYLPYYKNFIITLSEEDTAKTMLSQIREQNENFAYPEENLVFRINGMVVEGDQSIGQIVEKLGTSLQIDPVNAYRSNNGLIINDDDFMQSYALLAPFATEEDLAYYKTLYALHYASETEKFNHEYIGDAILVLAYRLISNGSEHKEEILEAICSANSGLLDCEYENNLFQAEDHNATIAKLKMMVKTPKKPSFLDTIASRFTKKPQEEENAAEITIEGKHIAYYAGSSKIDTQDIHEQIIQAGAKAVSFSREHKLSGLSLFEDNKPLALTKAATTMLDALDSGAEILIVEHETTLSMFKKHFSAIEKTIGRDIDIVLLSTEEFMSQISLAKA